MPICFCFFINPLTPRRVDQKGTKPYFRMKELKTHESSVM